MRGWSSSDDAGRVAVVAVTVTAEAKKTPTSGLLAMERAQARAQARARVKEQVKMRVKAQVKAS